MVKLKFLVTGSAGLIGQQVVKDLSKSNEVFSSYNDSMPEYGEPVRMDLRDHKQISGVFDEKNPDLICCFGWSELLKKRILNIAKIGSIGYHPTNLPHNRGRHPIIWTLVLGIKTTYSSFFFMSEKADFGHIIEKKKVIINNQDNSWQVYKKLSEIASKQLIKVLNHIQNKPNFYGRARKRSVLKNKYNF